MHRAVFACLLLTASVTARAQAAAPETTPPMPTQPVAPVTTPPRLISSTDPEFNPTQLDRKHRAPFDGVCLVSLLVDENGIPQDVKVVQPLDPILDEAAVTSVRKYRFKPATQDGHPVPIRITVNVAFHLKSPGGPLQHSRTASPKLIHSVDPRYTDQARQDHIQGSCLVGLTVDEHGDPQNVHIIRSLEPSLDDAAIAAVRQYKFQPATKEGEPIAVPISVSVEFRHF
jgi:TonB family protein